MQMAVIEFAKNVIGWKDAHSSEMNPQTPYPVIDLMEDQQGVTKKGGTMRLGSYDCKVKDKTLAKSIYGKATIKERHRHRWEFNNTFLKDFEAAGLVVSGTNPEKHLVEIVEIPNHPFFIGVQFHPELKSTVMTPHPLFVKFVKAAIQYKQKM